MYQQTPFYICEYMHKQKQNNTKNRNAKLTYQLSFKTCLRDGLA